MFARTTQVRTRFGAGKSRLRGMAGLLLWLLACYGGLASAAAEKRLVLIAGQKSHAPGDHEYLKSIKLFKVLLDRAPNLKGVRTEIYFNGWPDDPAVLDRADAIVFLSDGEDHLEPYASHAPFMTEERMKILDKQMKRGAGFMTFHPSTIAPTQYGKQIVEWNGAFCDVDGGHGEGGFYGAPDNPATKLWRCMIRDMEAKVEFGAPEHPIVEGVKPFRYKEEFYYQLTFRPNDARLQPIMRVPELTPDARDQIVGWAVERQNGGRGFGTTTGHYYENWRNDDYRKLILNALVWISGATVPKGGVQSVFVDDEEVDRALLVRPIPALLLTKASGAAANVVPIALNSETPRFDFKIAGDAAALTQDLSKYKLLVLQSCSWLQAANDAARKNVDKYLRTGGGLVVLYSADAATPAAKPTTLCPAVTWTTPEIAKTREGVKSFESDGVERAYRVFDVEVADAQHPITRALADFHVFDQSLRAFDYSFAGADNFKTLLKVPAKFSGTEQPAAFVGAQSSSRTFYLVVGNDASGVQDAGLTRLARYGSLWAAGE